MRRIQHWLMVAIVSLGMVVGTSACGGESDESSGSVTRVSSADLERDGEFWNSLTPDLKEELIDAGKAQLAGERPDGALEIKAYSSDELVAELDKQYSNAAKREISIYRTYTGANNRQALNTLDTAMRDLNRLCESEDAPPECDE